MSEPRTTIVVTDYIPPSRDGQDNVDATTEYYGRTRVSIQINGQEVMYVTLQMRKRKDQSDPSKQIVLTNYRTFRQRGATRPFFDSIAGITDQGLAKLIWDKTIEWCNAHNIEFAKAVVRENKSSIDLTSMLGVGEKPTKAAETSNEVQINNEHVSDVDIV